MNRDTCKKLLENGVLKAYGDGMVLEYKGLSDSHWRQVTNPSFDGDPDQYRVKPEPAMVAMKQEDFYPFFWVRHKRDKSGCHLVTYMDESAVMFGEDEPKLCTTYQELANNWEYSVDRKKWKPCTKELVPND